MKEVGSLWGIGGFAVEGGSMAGEEPRQAVASNLPDSPMSASRSSLPPLGEAEWRGGVGVGGGWARREGAEDDAAVGPGRPSEAAPYRRRSASGKRPHPARASPESALPATRLRRAGGGGGARRRPSICEYRSPCGGEGACSAALPRRRPCGI